MRIIGHIDMDAFFAAIEERDNPRFRGLPIVIGSDPKNGQGRGVVSTANYKAREYGIHSAMPITRAWRAAEAARQAGQPAAIFLPVDMVKYQKVSHSIMEEVFKFVPIIEQTSVDEAYLDLSFCGSFAQAEKLARKIKAQILKKERLTASVGIGPNKLIAKIASDMHKPDSLTVILPADAEHILELMPIRKIPGIGPKTESLFKKQGLQTVADLKKLSEAELYEQLGKWGLELYEKIRGRDESPLVLERIVKSIGEQVTFSEDTNQFSYIKEQADALCESVAATLKSEGFDSFKRVVLTMRFDNFSTKTKSRTLKNPANSAEILKREILNLLMPFFDRRGNPNKRKYRLIGVRVEELGKRN